MIKILKSHKYPSYFYLFYDSLRIIKNSIVSRHPILPKGMHGSSPIFILGSGRSGNTLLRASLCGHSKIGIPPESSVLPNIFRKYKYLNFLRWDDLVKIVLGEFQSHPQFFTWDLDISPIYKRALKLDKPDRCLHNVIDILYKYYLENKFPSAEIWGDKTPENIFYLNRLFKVFPSSKNIFLIRDGRDVVASFLKANVGQNQTIEEACSYWNKTVDIICNYTKELKGDKYILVRYEEFVTNPKIIITAICNYLNIDFQDSMLSPNLIFNKLGDAPKLAHHANLRNPINTRSVGKWRKELSNKQQDYVYRKLCGNLRRLGYE